MNFREDNLLPIRAGKWVLIALLLSLGGCTYTGGALLYMLGLGRGQLIEAKFQLTSHPLLILIDDPAQQVDWPPAMRHLFDQLAQELLRHEAAQKIVPRQTVEHLRQTVPNFAKRGAREVGEMAEAEQVLLINVLSYQATKEITEITSAAYLSVSVKVINVLKSAGHPRARLWPTSPRGHRVEIVLSGREIATGFSKGLISKELTTRLSVKLAKLFYDHRAGDFDL